MMKRTVVFSAQRQSYLRNSWYVLAATALLCLPVFFVPLGNMDELWNYNFARCVVNGLDLYTEVNILQTPLSVYLAAPFVAMFGGGLLAFRVASYVLLVCLVCLSFSLARRMTGSISLSVIISVFVYALLAPGFYYHYNAVSLCCLLLIILLRWQKPLTPVWGMVMGVLFGLLPLIKQSTGLALLAVCWLDCIIGLWRGHRRSYYLWCGCVSLIPGAVFAAWLWCSGRFAAFWDYAVLGIADFSHRITWKDFALSDPVSFLLVAVVVCLMGYVAVSIVRRKWFFEKQGLFFAMSIAWLLSVTYPLADRAHYVVGVIPLLLIFFMVVDIPAITSAQTVLLYSLSAFLAALTVVMGLRLDGNNQWSHTRHYEGVPINLKLEERITEVDAYIEVSQHPVRIADAYACLYHIPLDAYYADWDMLLKGNLGTKTVEELLDLPDDTLLLVPKYMESVNYQSHFALLNYIKEHYNCVDEVLDFEVYQKNESS